MKKRLAMQAIFEIYGENRQQCEDAWITLYNIGVIDRGNHSQTPDYYAKCEWTEGHNPNKKTWIYDGAPSEIIQQVRDALGLSSSSVIEPKPSPRPPKSTLIASPSHGRLYVEPLDYQVRLQEVVELVQTLLATDINLSMKKRILVHAIWEVNFASGRFKPRYRSAAAVQGNGEKVQRDHVYKKKALVDRLLQNPADVKSVVVSAIICLVTKDEHKKLTEMGRSHPDLGGWSRYHEAGITVYDMMTGTGT